MSSLLFLSSLTAGALSTGGLCGEFRQLIQTINIMAQHNKSGWDPVEVMDGVRNAIAVSIQEGNAMVLNESWKRIAERNLNHLLKPHDHRQVRRKKRRDVNWNVNIDANVNTDTSNVNESNSTVQDEERGATTIISAV